MKEYIEKIIEIILDNVSCEHQEIEEYPRGPKQDDPTYSLENEQMIIEQCIKAIPARLIERPEITTEFIEKKTTELHDKIWPEEKCNNLCRRQATIREFLLSLLNELAAKISLIGGA
ncbi:MAG: hypothetical protein KAR42_16975 [candidate division Zixibacteria bacterium]|nr:hypothetical protein [candidate division Zixibacteria bacterium]